MPTTFTPRKLMLFAIDALLGKNTPGANVALLLDGEIAGIAGAGYIDRKEKTMIKPSARFPIYSITKSLIATVILQLVEEGRLGLDEAVQATLPDLALTTPVTLRQLLNHTGGLPDYGALPAYFDAIRADSTHPWSADDFLAATLPGGLIFAPGTGWAYSNIGYLLLRRVIETRLQTSLRAALRERIFVPLGLEDTDVAESLEDMQALTPGYSLFFSPDQLQDVRARYHPGWVSHGVVCSTALELAQMLDAILSGRLLNAESRAAMLDAVDVPVQHPFFRKPAYGLGLMVDQESAMGVLAGHGGGGPGYAAGALSIVDAHGRRITCAALANSDRDDLALNLAFDVVMQAGQER